MIRALDLMPERHSDAAIEREYLQPGPGLVVSSSLAHRIASEHVRYRLATGGTLRDVLLEIGAAVPQAPSKAAVVDEVAAAWRRLSAMEDGS